ncbi:MAG: hypothetical protein WC342_08310 [Methanoregula sp.]
MDENVTAKNMWGNSALFSLVLIICVMFILVTGCINSSGVSDKDSSIQLTDANWTVVSEDNLTSKITYSVTGTFANHGSQTHTFYGGLTLVDADYKTFGYLGQSMTLASGQSKTITETYVRGFSDPPPVGIGYQII